MRIACSADSIFAYGAAIFHQVKLVKGIGGERKNNSPQLPLPSQLFHLIETAW